MDDDFEKKLDIIFKKIEGIISDNNEKKFDTYLKRINAISSLVIAFIALIISALTLAIYRNTYNITEEQFLLNTTENLALSVGSYNVDIVDLKPDEVDPEFYSRVELSICIINKSNLPISIVSGRVSKSDYGDSAWDRPTIHGLDFPISMQPQETKHLNCYMMIKIPDYIGEFIAEKFPESSDMDLDKIAKSLFFEKCTDLLGNEVIIEEEDGTTYFIQHLTQPFSLRLDTSKGNVFSTQFYEGGPQFIIDKDFTDELYEQYGEWGLRFSKERIVDDSSKILTFWEFVERDPSTLLMLIIPVAISIFVVVFVWGVFLNFLETLRAKRSTTMAQENQDNSSAEQEDSPIEQENSSEEREDLPAEQEDLLMEQGDLPAEQEDSPAEQEDSPAEQEDSSAEREDSPVEQEDLPIEQEDFPAEQEDSSAEREDSPIEQEDLPIEQ